MTNDKARRLMTQLLSRLIDEAQQAKDDLREKQLGKNTEKAINRISAVADALEDLLSLTNWGKRNA